MIDESELRDELSRVHVPHPTATWPPPPSGRVAPSGAAARG
ncbi:hypothetical protein [Tessaracoccus coleopterorum]|nr:hypothetical protein [Tessaracoccus coleopterorum]